MIKNIGLIGKGGFVKEIFASIDKNIFTPYILSDIGVLVSYIEQYDNSILRTLSCLLKVNAYRPKPNTIVK